MAISSLGSKKASIYFSFTTVDEEHLFSQFLRWKLYNRTQPRIRKPGTFHVAARVSPPSDQEAPHTPPGEEFGALMIITALTAETIQRGGNGRLLRSESGLKS